MAAGKIKQKRRNKDGYLKLLLHEPFNKADTDGEARRQTYYPGS